MFWKLKKFYRAVQAWEQQITQVRNRVDLEVLECLSPIDRYVVASGIYSDDALFDSTYEDWRLKRISKILEIYGIDYFKGKKVLELGCGHGDIGAFFAELGADVLCVDGRIQNINFARLKHRKINGMKFASMNLESDFTSVGKFDLIIHFGLLYHLGNVDDHMRRCFAIADDIVMETVVCDSTDPNNIIFCAERKHSAEEALGGMGNRPSPYYVERIAAENRFSISRYFTPDLNSGNYFYYDWDHKNDGRGVDGGDFQLRRFWRFQKTSVQQGNVANA